MKIINISGENGISTLDTFSIKRIINHLYRMTTSQVEDSSTGPISYVNDAGELVTIPAGTPLYFDGGYWNVGSFTNYISNSNDLSVWGRTFLSTLGNQPDPCGGLTATKLQRTGGPNSRIFYSNNGTFSGASVFSVVLKKDGYSWVKLRMDISGSFNGVWFDLANGNVGTSDTGCTGKIRDVGDGWYLCSILYTATTTSYVGLSLCDGDNTLESTIPTGNGVYMWMPLWTSGGQIYYPFLLETTGVSLTASSRAGTISAPIVSGSKLESLLNGSKDAKLIFKFTPYFNTSGLPSSTTKSILHSGTQSILQFRTDASGNGYIDLTDGTNTTSVALDWEYGVSYDIEMLFGNNVAESADKMQLIVDSTASTLSAFDGSLNPDTEMAIGYNNDYMFKITPPKFYTLKQSDWR